jgi:hypothetical protein
VTGVHPAGFVIFGAEMGTGMRTFSPTVLPHVIALTIVGVASPAAALVGAVGFAIGRTLMIPLYRIRTRDGRPYGFAVPLPVEVLLATAMVLVLTMAWLWLPH